MPFAFERGGSIAGIATVVGFAVSLASGPGGPQWPPRSAPWPFFDASATTFSAMLCGTSA